MSGGAVAPGDWVGAFKGYYSGSIWGTLTIVEAGGKLSGHIDESQLMERFVCDLDVTPKSGTNQAKIAAEASRCGGGKASTSEVTVAVDVQAVLNGDLMTIVGTITQTGRPAYPLNIDAIRQ